jgi:hypothetical protein
MWFSNLHSTFVVRLSMAKPSHALWIVADPITRKMPTRPFAVVFAEAGECERLYGRSASLSLCPQYRPNRGHRARSPNSDIAHSIDFRVFLPRQ